MDGLLKQFPNIKVLSFDIGDTLINLEKSVGFSSYFCSETGYSLNTIRDIVNSCFLLKDTSIDLAVREACQHIGYMDPDSIIHGYTLKPANLFDDVVSSLQLLSQSGYKIIACSNCSRWDADNSNSDLKKYISQFYYSFKLGVVKPDRAFFNLVKNDLSVECSEILHIGDSLNADYFGALEAGWHAALIDRKMHLNRDRIPNVLTIYNLSQLYT